MAFVPTSGPIRLTDIRNARNSDGSPGTTSTTFSVLRDNAVLSKFDLAYTGPIGSLSDITKFSQFRNYPNNVVTLYQTDFISWFGIANNQNSIYPLQPPSSPIQLLCGWTISNDDGRIFRSTDYGLSYSSVLTINQRLYRIRFLPTFRHASYLLVPPFLAVGEGGRIVTNSVATSTSFVTVSSPTTQDLFDISFNNSGVGIIVGDRRILKTNTNNRINAWSVVNSNSNIWRSAASDGSTFVVVGDDNSVITGNSLGTTWTPRSTAPISSGEMRGVTYHTDGYFYAVGFRSSDSTLPFFIRSSDSGTSWELYSTTGDTITGGLFSIESINGKLYVGGRNVQYEVEEGVARRFTADFSALATTRWRSIVKSDNSNGFHMAGTVGGSEFFSHLYGGYSIF
jgi:hypothetical protein